MLNSIGGLESNSLWANIMWNKYSEKKILSWYIGGVDLNCGKTLNNRDIFEQLSWREPYHQKK